MTATKAQLRKELEARRRIGARMANYCFNRAQYATTLPRDRDDMDRVRKDWDAIERVNLTEPVSGKDDE
jgi:hypothetical protein